MTQSIQVAADYLSTWDASKVRSYHSFSCKVRVRGAGRTGTIIVATKNGRDIFSINLTSDGLSIKNDVGAHNVDIGGLDDGSWHYLLYNSANGRVQVYIDGDLVYQKPGECWILEEPDNVFISKSSSGERLMAEVADGVFYKNDQSQEKAESLAGLPVAKHFSPLKNGNDFYYRIPALLAVDDTLILVADRRKGSPNDAPNTIDLVITKSFDLGKTWSDPEVLVPPFMGGASTDACLLLDPKTQRIWCFFSGYEKGMSQPAVLAKVDGARAHVLCVYSDDKGSSWSEVQEISPTNLAEGIVCLGVSPGVGAIDRDNNLIVPVYHEVKDANGELDFAATILSSQNGGGTWQVGQPINADGHATYESAVAMYGNEVVLFARNQHPSASILRATTTDFGANWLNVELVEQLPEVFSQPAAINSDDNTIIFANPTALLPYRGWGVIRASKDGGKTWPTHRTLNALRHGYQSIALINNQLVVAYEEDWEAIHVAVCPKGWLYRSQT